MNAQKTQPAKVEKSSQSQQASERRTHKVPCPPQPVLRFTPTAWAKLLFFRDRGQTEIGGFAVTSKDDLLQVVDFVTVKQEVNVASVIFDDEAVADFFETQVDAGRKPEQFARVWLHSHPGNSPEPSHTDQETFYRVFGKCEWAVMFIVARNGKTSARLRFNVGPHGEILIPVQVDYATLFSAAAPDVWEAEYQANIKADNSFDYFGGPEETVFDEETYGYSNSQDWLDELEAMDPGERKLIMDELSTRPDLW